MGVLFFRVWGISFGRSLIHKVWYCSSQVINLWVGLFYRLGFAFCIWNQPSFSITSVTDTAYIRHSITHATVHRNPTCRFSCETARDSSSCRSLIYMLSGEVLLSGGEPDFINWQEHLSFGPEIRDSFFFYKSRDWRMGEVISFLLWTK